MKINKLKKSLKNIHYLFTEENNIIFFIFIIKINTKNMLLKHLLNIFFY